MVANVFVCDFQVNFGLLQFIFSSTMEVSSSPLCYELLAEIGEGSYGKVYKAREEGGKQRLLAVKKFNFRGDASQVGIPAVMVREAALMRKMKYFNHPNIVK